MTTRRYLAGIFLAAAALCAQAKDAFTPQENLVVKDVGQRGLSRFIMLNEKLGRLYAIDQGKIVFSVPAISGEDRGDSLTESPGATPAGIFPLFISPYQSRPDAVLRFAELGNLAYVIHWAASPQRVKLLNNSELANPDKALRRSAGCINLLPADYRKISAFVSGAAQSLTTHDGTFVRRDSFLVILPETENLQETRRFYGMPSP